MPSPPMPEGESARLRALYALGVLDTADEPEYSALARIASIATDMPVALVTFVDAQRQWIKANVGLPGVEETPRDVAFCAYTITQDDVFEVADATADPRFADNALVVGAPAVRAYAGAPIVLDDGARVGAVCVIDHRPHRLDARQKMVLRQLAASAAAALEARRDILMGRRQAGRHVIRKLAQSEARFDTLGAASPLGVFQCDDQGHCSYVNARWQALAQMDGEQARARGWMACVHADDRDRLRQAWQAARHDGVALCEAHRIVRGDGSERTVRTRIHAVPDEQGTAVAFVGTVEDITCAEHMHQEIERQRELLHVTLASVGDGVVTTDGEGRVTWMNAVAERLSGWDEKQARGRPLHEVLCLVDEATRQPARDPVQWCLRENRTVEPGEPILLVSRDGHEYGIEDSASPIRHGDGQMLGAVMVFQDVTEQRRLSREMSYRAQHDALTGLLNRSEFESRLTQFWQRVQDGSSVHALAFIDLDQFKIVNDTCGHAEGDRLLKQVTRLLRSTVRKTDLVARLGGDEFAILMPHCALVDAERVAGNICTLLDNYRFAHEDRVFRVGASIGLVAVDARWTSIAAIQQAADAACYLAKENGRNRYEVWREGDQSLRARSGDTQWASRIEKALQDETFELYVQPIAPIGGVGAEIPDALASGMAEVLLRLPGTQGEVVVAGAFMPAVERFHLSTRVDRWVLAQVLERLRDTRMRQAAELLAVNLSGQSVSDRLFLLHALKMLRHAGREVCARLCIEITETVVISHMAEAAEFVACCRELGVRVALDDFGSGASSFGYLKRLAVDFLKIDGQFIRGMASDPLDEVAVRCFIEAAHVSGLKTIAECVETTAVAARLRQIGADFVQGHLVARPLPIGTWLAQRRPGA